MTSELIKPLLEEDKALEKEGKDMSLADRAAGAKEMSAGLAQDTPERNFDRDARQWNGVDVHQCFGANKHIWNFALRKEGGCHATERAN